MTKLNPLVLYDIINSFKPLKLIPLKSSTNKILKGSSTTSSFFYIFLFRYLKREFVSFAQPLPVLSKLSDIQTNSKVEIADRNIFVNDFRSNDYSSIGMLL